jgi:hypothetical protein
MKPDDRYADLPHSFWANVRTISEQVGYTRDKQIKIPSLSDMQTAMHRLGLSSQHIVDESSHPTELGKSLASYFQHRANTLNESVEPLLMDADEAKELFREIRGKLRPTCPIPMNKQRGKKKAPAYFTAIINMLIEAHGHALPCEYDPRRLTTVTRAGTPLRTLARRLDGAFPEVVNPVAIWEIKEYYYTTTFGSRVADGVYETLLDGMELKELRDHEGVDVRHYLMIDSHYTWWDCGRSYLCRIVDMLNMGYVDEVLFGREVTTRLPGLVEEWVALARERDG